MATRVAYAKRLAICELYMNPQTAESRMDKPVLIRLSSTDRKLLKRASREMKIPMATLAHQCVRQFLDRKYSEGAQS